jgi:hypothetical protein
MKHPGRRCARAGAHHRLDAVPAHQFNRLIQPLEMIFAFSWLDFAPGKFTQAHAIYTCLLHEVCIQQPAILRPVFGIISDSKIHSASQSISSRKASAAVTIAGRPANMRTIWIASTT